MTARTPADYWRAPETSRYIGVHRSTVYKYARAGKIPAIRIGGSWRFNKDDLDAFIAAGGAR